MKLLPRLILLLSILAAGTLADQTTKSLAREKLIPGKTASYLFDTIRLVYTENSGAFGSLGQNLPDIGRFIILTVAPAFILIILLIYIILSNKITPVQTAAFSMILTGGANNIYNRVFDNCVIDFLNVGIGPVIRTFIFNIADMLITFGFIIVILLVLFEKKGDEKKATPGNV